jgi:hypothetical protein
MLIQSERSRDGYPMLCIEDMNYEAKRFFRNLMILNRVDNKTLQCRAIAGAHLTHWDATLGTATITMHGDSIEPFIEYIEYSLMVRVGEYSK